MKALITSEKREQREIPAKLLKPSPLNSFETGDIEDLSGSVEGMGIITPISVAGPDPEGSYEILSGERRYRSFMALNKDSDGTATLPCYVLGPYDMPDIYKALLIETSNIETREDYNRDAHRFKILQLYKQLAQEGEIGEEEVTKYLSKAMKTSKRYGRMYKAIFESGVPELQESVKSDVKEPGEKGEGPVHIRVSEASRIAMMEPEKQREIIGRVNNGEKAEDAIAGVSRQKNPSKNTSPTPSKGTKAVMEPANDVQPERIDTFGKNYGMYDGGGDGFDDDGTDGYGYGDPDGYGEQDSYRGPDRYGEPDSQSVESPDMDDSIRRMVENGEDVNVDDLDTVSLLHRFQAKNGYGNVSIDTSGLLKKMQDDEKEPVSKKAQRRAVSAWIRSVRKRIEKDEPLDEEDDMVMDELAELIDVYRNARV